MSPPKKTSGANPPKVQKNPFGVKVMGIGEKKPSSSLISFGVGVLNDLHFVETSSVSEKSSLKNKEVVDESNLQIKVYQPLVIPCVATPLKTIYPVPDSPEPVYAGVNLDASSHANVFEEVLLKRKDSGKSPVVKSFVSATSEKEDSDDVPLATIVKELMKSVKNMDDGGSSQKKTKSVSVSSTKKLSVGECSKKRKSQRIRSTKLKGMTSKENEVINIDVEDYVSPEKKMESTAGSKKRKVPEVDIAVEDDVLNIRSSERRVNRKIVDKKGKAPVEVSDAEPDVQDIRTTEKKTKSAAKKDRGCRSDASKKKKKDSKKGESSIVIFHSKGSEDRWPSVIQRRIPVERPLGPDVKECEEIMALIKKAELLKSVSGFTKCYAQLVREFISNLTLDVAMPGSDNFHRVCVRGKRVLFSPDVINSALDRSDEFHEDIEVDLDLIAEVITAGKVKVWPAKKLLSSGLLSVKYAILSRIGMQNWIPSNHTSAISVSLARLIYWIGTESKIDFGSFVFEQTMKHAESFAVKLPISFPSLLSAIMLKQHPDLLLSTDVALPKGAVLTLDHRLFQDPHVLDIALPSGRTPGTLSASGSKSVLAEMEELSKELQEIIRTTSLRKEKVDALICKLRKDGVPADCSRDVSAERSEKVVDDKSESGSDAATDVGVDVEESSDDESEDKDAGETGSSSD